MMRGYKDKHKKFHPINQKRGIRKKVHSHLSDLHKGVPINKFPFEVQGTKGLLGNEKSTSVRQNFAQAEKAIRDEGFDTVINRQTGEVILTKEQNLAELQSRKKRDVFDKDEEQEPIVAQFDKGDVVMISPDNDNDNYDEFKGKKLRITHVATNIDEHRGFDEGVGQALYDLETIHGKEIGFSLYDYELVSA